MLILSRFLEPEAISAGWDMVFNEWCEQQWDDLCAVLYLISSQPSLVPWSRTVIDLLGHLPESARRYLICDPSFVSWRQMAEAISVGSNTASEENITRGFILADINLFIITALVKYEIPVDCDAFLEGQRTHTFRGLGFSIKSKTKIKISWKDGVLRVNGNELGSFECQNSWETCEENQDYVILYNKIIHGKIEVDCRTNYLVANFLDSADFSLPSSGIIYESTKIFNQAFAFLTELWPELSAEVLKIDSHIVSYVDTANPNTISSFSSNSVPGALYISFVKNGSETFISYLDVLDSLVHEHLHQKLYLFESIYPVYDPLIGQGFASPWKKELRPIGGVFHGYFVFSGLRRLWKKALVSKDESVRLYAQTRMSEIDEQLKLAEPVLRKNCIFSEVGQNLFHYLVSGNHAD
jgi:hypothetical protein